MIWTQRMPGNRLPRKILEEEPEGKRWKEDPKRDGWSKTEHDKQWTDRRGYQRHVEKLSSGWRRTTVKWKISQMMMYIVSVVMHHDRSTLSEIQCCTLNEDNSTLISKSLYNCYVERKGHGWHYLVEFHHDFSNIKIYIYSVIINGFELCKENWTRSVVSCT
jgi:hypothetical protein